MSNNDFSAVLKDHRLKYKIDRSGVSDKGHINYQTITKIENGEFDSVSADKLLAYLRLLGFKISAGVPRINNKNLNIITIYRN